MPTSQRIFQWYILKLNTVEPQINADGKLVIMQPERNFDGAAVLQLLHFQELHDPPDKDPMEMEWISVPERDVYVWLE